MNDSAANVHRESPGTSRSNAIPNAPSTPTVKHHGPRPAHATTRPPGAYLPVSGYPALRQAAMPPVTLTMSVLP